MSAEPRIATTYATGRSRLVPEDPGLSIRGSLMLAAGSVVVLLVLISMVAWMLYDFLGKGIDQMSQETLPRVVASRQLAMTSKGLSNLATEMVLVENSEELDQKIFFAERITSRVTSSLESASTILPDRQILANLEQLYGQLAGSLNELEEKVRERLELTEKKRLYKSFWLKDYTDVTRLMVQILKDQARPPGQSGTSRGSGVGMPGPEQRFYLEMLFIVTEASQIIQRIDLASSLREVESERSIFESLMQRLDRLSRAEHRDFLVNELVEFSAPLSLTLSSRPELFDLQSRIVTLKAHEGSLAVSCGRLSSQVELLTSTVVENSSRQASELSRDAVSQIVQAKLVIVALVCVSLVLVVVLIWIIGGRSLAAPLIGVVRSVGEIEQGNYLVQAPVTGATEIRVLARSINRMAKQLADRDQDLQQLQTLLNNVIDSLAAVIVAVNSRLEILLWNSQAETFFDLSSDKAVGSRLAGAVGTLPIDEAMIRDVIDKGQSRYIKKIPVDTVEGFPVVDLTLFPLHYGRGKGVVIRIDDVTEKTRIEEIMVQSEKMLSVGGLAAGMAHEINNPLAGILQNAQVIENRLSQDLPANRKAAKELGLSLDTVKAYMDRRQIFLLLGSIREAGERAAQIVENMLSFSRKGGQAFSTHDLADLLDRTVELAQKDYDLKKHFDFRQLTIIREYEEGIPQIPCESSKIQQVFLNILRNGAEAMAEERYRLLRSLPDGETVKTFWFVLRLSREPLHIRVEIEDNGPGMDERIRTRIFEPFFTTKEVGVGTGLGLSVSYFIVVENHGGTLEVKSSPGKGTRFIIRLPIER